MGSVRFWRRFKIAPGVTLNISKTGFSVSIGPKGAKYTIGTSGSRFTVGVPGTGLHYTHKFGSESKGKGKAREKEPEETPVTPPPELEASEPVPQIEAPDIAIPQEDLEAFAAACDAIAEGDEVTGRTTLQGLVHWADAAFLAGVLWLRSEESPERAAAMLRSAYGAREQMGQVFAASERELTMELPISDEVNVRLKPDALGCALAYVEALQRLEQIDQGIAVLDEMNATHPNHPLIQMSLDDLKAA